jgi:hypothetical protein
VDITFSIIFCQIFFIFVHLTLKLNTEIYSEKFREPLLIIPTWMSDNKNVIPEFSVTGMFWSAASVICSGNLDSVLLLSLTFIFSLSLSFSLFLSASFITFFLVDEKVLIIKVLYRSSKLLWGKMATPLLLLLISLLPAATAAAAAAGHLDGGFMRDFFARFPHLPAFSLFEVRRYNFNSKVFFS